MLLFSNDRRVRMDVSIIILAVLGVITLVMNIYAYALYAKDKRIAPTATDGKGRVKERTLIMVAFLMGGVGAAIAMKTLRHKTKHLSFKILVPLGIVVNIAVIAGVVVLALVVL